MALVELALVLVYTCVLLIKSCQSSPATCSDYGFGDANGLYLFFIFFGLSLLLSLLIIALTKLYASHQSNWTDRVFLALA